MCLMVLVWVWLVFGFMEVFMLNEVRIWFRFVWLVVSVDGFIRSWVVLCILGGNVVMMFGLLRIELRL